MLWIVCADLRLYLLYALSDKHVDDDCIEEPAKSGIELMAVFPVSGQPFRE